MLKLTVTCIVLLALLPAQVEGQSILRLFSTPAERADLERERQRMYRPGQIEELPEPELELPLELPEIIESEPEPDVIYQIGGSMQRADGRFTVWVNGLPINQEDLPANMELLQPFSQGRMRIVNPDSGASFEVKPGQVLNLSRGQLFESYDFVEPPPVQAAVSVTDSPAESASLDTEESEN